MSGITFTRAALMGKGAVVLAALAAAVVFAVPAAADTSPPTADPGVVSIQRLPADGGARHPRHLHRGHPQQRPRDGRTKFIVRVTAAHGTLTVRGGGVSESAFEDDNPFNQYRTASIPVG